MTRQSLHANPILNPAETAIMTSALSEFGFATAQNSASISVATKITSDILPKSTTAVRATRQDAELRYSAGILELGDEAISFLNSAALHDSVFELTGKRFALVNDMSCVTIYQPGDRLGAHLDQPADRCAFTCILYLACQSPDADADDSGLQLLVYGQTRASTYLPSRLTIPTNPGRLVLGYGSRVWHERPPLKAGETVTAVTACFQEV